MKPLDKSLDYLLTHLYGNRFKKEGERIPFDVDHVVMPKLELKNHEEFKNLIDILVEHKNAFFLEQPNGDLEIYKKRTMISVKGIYHHLRGGYDTQRKKDATELLYKNLTTFALIFGGVAAGIYYIVQLLSPLVNKIHSCH